MVLKVDPDELVNVSNVMKNDSDKYKTEIDTMEATLEKLKNVWKGGDADAFIENLTYFLTRMRGIPETLSTLSQLCNKSNEGYTSRDEEFAKELKGSVANHE